MYRTYTLSSYVDQLIANPPKKNQKQQHKEATQEPVRLNQSTNSTNSIKIQSKVHKINSHEPIKIHSKLNASANLPSHKAQEQKKIQPVQITKNQPRILYSTRTDPKPIQKYKQQRKNQHEQATRIQPKVLYSTATSRTQQKPIQLERHKQSQKIQAQVKPQPVQVKPESVQSNKTQTKFYTTTSMIRTEQKPIEKQKQKQLSNLKQSVKIQTTPKRYQIKQRVIEQPPKQKEVVQQKIPIEQTPKRLQKVFSTPPSNSQNKIQRTDFQELPKHYHIEQNLVLSEFKIKYDELKANYDKLRIQFDDVSRQKKKIQIKFLNSNPEYYEKQIKRLRTEVQKFQQQNQDHKYKYLQAQNAKKQFEASYKVKQQQLKTILKQLQKQKVSNVELKHQNDQKQRVFNRIKVQFERSNENVLKNYDEVVTKSNKFEGALKTKIAQYDQLKNNYERTERRLNQTKEQFKKYRQANQQKVKNLTKNIQTKAIQGQKAKTESSNTIRQLSAQIQRYKTQRVSAQLLKERKSEQVTAMRSNRQLELDVVRLQDRIRFLEYELVKKDQIIIQLQKTIEKIKLQDEVKQLQEKIAGLMEKITDINRQNQRTKGQLVRQIDRLKIELMQSSQKVIFSGHTTHANFQQILRVQLEQNAKLKRQLSIKIDEIYNLKSDIDQLKVQKQNTMSQMQVLKKMRKADQKNSKIEAQVASQYIKNDIDSYKRKLEQLQTKLGLKVKEVKDKDNFIMNSVLGRSKAEQAPLILADFQRIFQANYVEKLNQANQRIQDLLKNKK